MSVMESIKTRIHAMNDGDIMTTADFADLANLTTIRKHLGRCVDKGLIRRVFDGVYEKPHYSRLLDEYMPTDPEKVAYALARTFHWTIAPCGDIALNRLGLTTQVPSVWSYVSDGPYRTFSWDHIQLKFKHKTNREISMLSAQTILITEALRALGKERITPDIIGQLRKIIPECDREKILTESSSCSEWIHETIRKVCAS